MGKRLANMRFEGFEWAVNPLSLSILQSLETSVLLTGAEEEYKEDFGRSAGVYKGEGEFCGEDALLKYKELEAHFMKHKRGVLTLPDFEPFEAYFTRLSLECDPTPRLVKYTFEFRRDLSASPYFRKKSLYLAKEGDSLYDVAYSQGVTVDKLVSLNPGLRSIGRLSQGEQVKLC